MLWGYTEYIYNKITWHQMETLVWLKEKYFLLFNECKDNFLFSIISWPIMVIILYEVFTFFHHTVCFGRGIWKFSWTVFILGHCCHQKQMTELQVLRNVQRKHSRMYVSDCRKVTFEYTENKNYGISHMQKVIIIKHNEKISGVCQGTSNQNAGFCQHHVSVCGNAKPMRLNTEHMKNLFHTHTCRYWWD